jgi:hypothetical protein
MMFIQEFYRKYGPMEVDFYCHPKKLADAKFLFSPVTFVRNIISVNYLTTLEQNYDLIVYIRYLVKYGIRNHDRLLAHNADLLNAIDIARARFEPYHFIFDSHPYLDGVLARSIAWQRMNLADAVGDAVMYPSIARPFRLWRRTRQPTRFCNASDLPIRPTSRCTTALTRATCH